MRPPASHGSGHGLKEVHETIQRFIAGSREPVLLEPGEQPIPLTSGSCDLAFESGRLTLQAWTADRNLVRKIVGISLEKPGRLELQIEKFGKRTGEVVLLDEARPQNQAVSRKAARSTYRELFRRMLSRTYPGWTIAEISTEADLEHSLSPVYSRALLRKGPKAIAAMLAPDEPGAPECVLTFALIWLDYVSRRQRSITTDALAVFVPQGQETTTCLRLRHIGRTGVHFAAYAYSEDGSAHSLDLTDSGNVKSVVPVLKAQSAALYQSPLDERLFDLCKLDGVEITTTGAGERSLRVRGLEFARRRIDGEWSAGLETKRKVAPSNVAEVEALARELVRLRSAGSTDPHGPLCTRQPELWLEHEVRRSIQQIDATLHANPIYGQVPAFTAGERSIIDLLACDFAGRLAIVELKASQDIHLPMQALDYWIQVKWHLDRGEFANKGYFPGIELRRESPRMLLVAPSLEWHPATETLFGFLDPEIEIHKIGLGMDWQQNVRVMFRTGRDTRVTTGGQTK